MAFGRGRVVLLLVIPHYAFRLCRCAECTVKGGKWSLLSAGLRGYLAKEKEILRETGRFITLSAVGDEFWPVLCVSSLLMSSP